MAKTFDGSEGNPLPPALENAGDPAGQPQQQRVQVEIDDSKVMALYANFCRVTGTPEELIIDFGLKSATVRSADASDSRHATDHHELLHGQTHASRLGSNDSAS